MSVWEKQAHTISVYHTHHLLVLLAFHSAVPMTLVHLALNLYSENKTRNPNTDQFKIHDCFSFPGWHLLWFRPPDHPDTTGLHSFKLGLQSAVPHSSVLQCYSKNPLLCSALMSPLPIFTNCFLNLHSHQAFLLFCCIFPNGVLNLPDLFHATPQLEDYPTFSSINHSSPLQNITPILISLNLKGWEFF